MRYAKLSEANLYDTDFSSLPESVEADLRIRQTYLGWADLSKADLRHAKFREANLLRTKFTNADLRETDFRGAHFIGTCLCGADLSNTKLNGAVFKVYHIPKEKTKDKIKDKISRVNLRGTNLNGADLSGADLGGADLSGTDLKLVQSLQGTNLRGVKGLTREQLEACKARGALIDGDIDETPSQLTSSLSTLSQNTDTQSSPPQESSSYPNKNEKSASLARQSNDAQAAATAPTQEVTPSTITDNKAPIQQNSDTLS